MSGDLESLLENFEVAMDAFAVCEIGFDRAIACESFDKIVVHFVVSGHGSLEWSGGSAALAPGTMVIVPRNCPKTLSGEGPVESVVERAEGCPWVGGLVRFDEATGERNMTLACAALSLSRIPENSLFSRLEQPLVERATDASILLLFQAIERELSEARTGMKAVLGTLMKQILLLFLRANDEREGGHSLLGCAMSHSGLNAAVQSILSRPQDPHTVGQLAAKAGMSRTCFNNQFTSTYGVTPMNFVNSVRLDRAAQMLETSSVPIKGIAVDVGYASRSHFSRAFRERFGVDPSSYRDQAHARARRPASEPKGDFLSTEGGVYSTGKSLCPPAFAPNDAA